MSKKRRTASDEQRSTINPGDATSEEPKAANKGRRAASHKRQVMSDKPHATSHTQNAHVLTLECFNSIWCSALSTHRSTLLAVAGLLMVICLTLTAQHPLMFGSLTRTDDALQHLYRLVALDSSIRHGDLWPRYAPTLVYGYGIPLFNFYSPLSLYPLEILHLLGLRFLNALLVGLMLYTVLGALGAYQLGKRWSGTLGGIGAAVAYTYAPYSIVNLYQRGAIGEVAGLALLPWVLWAFDRLAEHERRCDFALAVFCCSLLILTHNITALYGVFLLIPYCLLLWWTGKNPPRIFVHLILAGIVAVGLTTFFWLPALAEAQFVQLGRMSIGVAARPGTPAFYGAFQSLTETFAFPQSADLTRFNQPEHYTLGWPQILLGILGAILTFWRFPERTHEQREPRGRVILALVLTVGLVFTTTRLSAWLWTTIPFIYRFQFPWRGLGPASLMVALLAGVGVRLAAKRISWRIGQGLWVMLCVTTMVLYVMPWLYHLYIPDPAAESIVDAQDYERKTGQIAGTAAGEYLPKWLKKIPDSERLIGLYAQGEVIPRLQPLPRVVAVEQVSWGMTHTQLTFDSKEDTTLTFDWLYFPGWWAELDHEPIAVFPTEPSGLLGINVPAGEHSLEVGFGPTLLRLGAMIASGVFLLVLAGTLIFATPLWRDFLSNSSDRVLSSEVVNQSTASIMLSVALLGALLFAGKAVLIDNLQTPFKRARFAEGIEAGLQIPVQANFEGQIDLLGYDIISSQLASGQTAHLTLYWRPTNGTIAGDYSSVVFLRDAAGTIVTQTGSIYPGGWATHDWLSGFYVLEKLHLTVPPGTPPGQYTLEASLFWQAENRSLNTFDQQGNSLGITVPIGELTITRPSRAARREDLAIDADQSLLLLDAPLNDSLRLLAANQPPASAGVGQLFILIADWQAQSQPVYTHAFRALWLDKSGQVAAATPSTPLVVSYPTDQWESGDIWKGIHPLFVPGRLEAGDYTVALQLFDEAGEASGELVEIGRMAVNTPERTFEAPRMGVTADVAWENGIRLLGYDLPEQRVAQEDGLGLTLYWQSETDINTNLTVFVHIYDAESRTVAQQDSIPLGGARPTTGWAPGEILADRYAIFIPANVLPDHYWIRIGWYNAVTGERVHLPDGSEFWILPQSVRVIAP